MLSRIASLLAPTTACTASLGYEVAPRDVPALVSEYRMKGEVTGRSEGRTMKVDEGQGPMLAIDRKRCVAPSVEECDARDFHLRELSVLGDEIVADSGERYRVDDIDSATLTLANEPRVHELRHRFGGQAGGSGIFQPFYRFRAVGPLFLDVGLGFLPLAGPPVGNGSGGLVVDVPVAARWSVYAGAGGGFVFLSGETEEGLGTTTFAFLYGRVGFSFLFSTKEKVFLALDGGFWRGTVSEDEGSGTHSSHRFLWPMAGAALIKAF